MISKGGWKLSSLEAMGRTARVQMFVVDPMCAGTSIYTIALLSLVSGA